VSKINREEVRYLLMDALEIYYGENERDNRHIVETVLSAIPSLHEEIISAKLPSYLIDDTLVCFQDEPDLVLKQLIFLDRANNKEGRVYHVPLT